MMLCVALIPALTMVSCGDDDDNTQSLAQQVSGTYPVNVWVAIAPGNIDKTQPAIPVNVNVSAAGENSLNFTLSQFKLTSEAEPMDIEVKGMSVTGSEANAVVTYNGIITSTPPMGHLTSAITGTIKNKVMDMNLNIELRGQASDPSPAMTIKVAIESRN